jgi:hypothetical protein
LLHFQVAYYINENLGPYFCQAKKSALNLWNQARPYFQRLGENVIHLWRDLVAWCRCYKNFFFSTLTTSLSPATLSGYIGLIITDDEAKQASVCP